MIKTIDLIEFCSRAEQSNRLNGHGPAADATRAGRIGKAVAYMLEHLEKPVPIATLGKIAGVSSSHFYLLFKAATGCTPNDFFIRARMRHACELLRGTDLSVKEVAAALGYDDQFYFSRVFKSVNGVPPRTYRALQAELEPAAKNSALEHFERKTVPALAPFPLNSHEAGRINHFGGATTSNGTRPQAKTTQQNKPINQ